VKEEETGEVGKIRGLREEEIDRKKARAGGRNFEPAQRRKGDRESSRVGGILVTKKPGAESRGKSPLSQQIEKRAFSRGE